MKGVTLGLPDEWFPTTFLWESMSYEVILQPNTDDLSFSTYHYTVFVAPMPNAVPFYYSLMCEFSLCL